MLRRISALPLAMIMLAAAAACDDEPTAPENPQDISITVAPASLTLDQGESSTLTVTLTSTGGYTGNVLVAAENSPDGVVIEGATIEGGAGSAELDIVIADNALLGTANISIRAIGPGVSETSTTLSLTVQAP